MTSVIDWDRRFFEKRGFWPSHEAIAKFRATGQRLDAEDYNNLGFAKGCRSAPKNALNNCMSEAPDNQEKLDIYDTSRYIKD